MDTVLLGRHGFSAHNRDGYLAGNELDTPLLKEGVEGALRVRDALRSRGITVDHVLTSPLTRSLITGLLQAGLAEPAYGEEGLIFDASNHPEMRIQASSTDYVMVEDLLEKSWGTMSGLGRAFVEDYWRALGADYGGPFDAHPFEDVDIRPKNGESVRDVYDRVTALWRSLRTDETLRGVTLISSHGATLFALRYVIEGLDLPPSTSLEKMSCPHDSLLIYDRQHDGSYSLVDRIDATPANA